jgi:putative addiction module killer protein
MIIRSTPEFDDWFWDLRAHDRAHIRDRFDRIREHNHFGDRKHLGDALFELRWKNGRRVYCSLVKDSMDNVVLMLLGGSKNGQERDIARARKILGREDA